MSLTMQVQHDYTNKMFNDEVQIKYERYENIIKSWFRSIIAQKRNTLVQLRTNKISFII